MAATMKRLALKLYCSTVVQTVAAVATMLALSGCESMQRLPPVDMVMPTAAMPVPASDQALPPAHSGAIFQAATYRPLFEDHRARIVGDTVMVTIVEKISAVQKSTSSIDRSDTATGAITAVPFLKSTALTRASLNGSGANSFSGKGTVENSNDFSGTITATVVQVLPNGHLIVAAEKQIGVNANVDVLRFSGQIDPRAIAPGNTVQSTQIANVRIEQRGRGQQAEAQSMGWLSRFFMTVLPF
jgi:flagellar L-ring protein precursor FlgH